MQFAWNCLIYDVTFGDLRDLPEDLPTRGVAESSFWVFAFSQIINLNFLLRELSQLVRERLAYITSIWNMVQLVAHGMQLLLFVLVLVDYEDEIQVRVVGSVAMMAPWINLLFYLKSLAGFSFLVEMMVDP